MKMEKLRIWNQVLLFPLINHTNWIKNNNPTLKNVVFYLIQLINDSANVDVVNYRRDQTRVDESNYIA